MIKESVDCFRITRQITQLMFDILNSKMTQKCNRLSKYLAIFYFIGSYLLFSQVRTQQKAVAAPSVADCVDTASYQSEYGRISAVIYAPCIFSVFHHGGSSVVQPGAAAGTRLIFKHADFSRSLCICIYKAHSLSQVSIMTAACMQGRGGGRSSGVKGEHRCHLLSAWREQRRTADTLEDWRRFVFTHRATGTISAQSSICSTTCKGNTLYWIHQTT